MAQTTINDKTNDKSEDERLLRMLDRGIDDIEAERELPLEEAFEKISELRVSRCTKLFRLLRCFIEII